MESKNMIGGIVSLAVVVICVAAIMMPVLSEYTAAEKTYTNEGMPYAVVDEGEHTILVTDDTITVDDESVDLSLFPSGFTQYTLVFTTDGNFIRMDYSANAARIVTSALTTYSVASNETVTIAISGTTATVSSSDTSTTSSSVSNVSHYISTEGDYVMALNPCVTSDSTILGAGQTTFRTTDGLPATTYIYSSWTGDVDSVTASIIYVQSSNGYTSNEVSSTEVNTTSVGGNLVRIDSVLLNFALTDTSDTYDVTATYTYFLAPAEVTYDNPDYLGSGNSALVLAIPTIVIVSLIIAAVGTFVIGKRD